MLLSVLATIVLALLSLWGIWVLIRIASFPDEMKMFLFVIAVVVILIVCYRFHPIIPL